MGYSSTVPGRLGAPFRDGQGTLIARDRPQKLAQIPYDLQRHPPVPPHLRPDRRTVGQGPNDSGIPKSRHLTAKPQMQEEAPDHRPGHSAGAQGNSSDVAQMAIEPSVGPGDADLLVGTVRQDFVEGGLFGRVDGQSRADLVGHSVGDVLATVARERRQPRRRILVCFAAVGLGRHLDQSTLVRQIVGVVLALLRASRGGASWPGASFGRRAIPLVMDADREVDGPVGAGTATPLGGGGRVPPGRHRSRGPGGPGGPGGPVHHGGFTRITSRVLGGRPASVRRGGRAVGR